MVLTPAGKVAQYFYGIEYPVQDLRLALVQGSHEQIGSVVDQILLYCCTYDPGTGRYHALVSRLLEISGGGTILLIGSGLFLLFRWDAKRKSQAASSLEMSKSRDVADAGEMGDGTLCSFFRERHWDRGSRG